MSRLCSCRKTINMQPAKTNKSCLYRWQRIHPALIVGHVLTVKGRRAAPMSLLAQQSAYCGSCGLMTLAMILVAFGLAKSYALTEMSRRKFGVPSDVWREFYEVYFSGVEPRDFVERIHRLNLPLIVTARYRDASNLDRFAIDNLAKGELVALSFKSVQTRRTNHWALGIGSEGQQIGRVAKADTLLLLDPSAVEPVFRAFNSRLKISETSRSTGVAKTTGKPKPITWMYDSTEWMPEQVRLTSAIRFRLSG